jgi:O-antigen ligase
LPSVGLQEDAFAGFFAQKNGLGPAMVLGMVTIACLAGNTVKRTGLEVVAMTVFLVLLIGSKNAAGVLSALVLAAILPALILSRRKGSLTSIAVITFGLAIVITLGATLGYDLDDLLGIFGKDSTFTGRTQLWEDVTNAIGDRPLLGYGYGAFWGIDGPAARLVYADIHWAPASAHNGFIEVALGMGFLGGTILVLFLGVALWRGLLMFWRGQDLLSAWPLLATIYVILSNLSNATFGTVESTVDFLIVAAAFFFSTEANMKHREQERNKQRVTQRSRGDVPKQAAWS